MKVRAKLTAGLLAAGMLLAAGCGGGSGGSGGGSDKLTLVAYSTPREAYEQLIPEFQKTDAGKGVVFHPVLRRLRRPEPRPPERPGRRRGHPGP